MEIPNMPRSPVDIDEETMALIESLQDKWFAHPVITSCRYKVKSIEAIGIMDEILYILGRAGPRNNLFFEIQRNIKSENADVGEIVFEPYYGRGIFGCIAWIFTFGLYDKWFNIKERSKQTNEYFTKCFKIEQANQTEINEKVKGIKIFQGTIAEVEAELNVALKMIDTGKPEKFIKATDTFWLRAKARRIGADAIVHYQPGSSIGTPVQIIYKS
jgi:hypothetical protein